MPNGGSKRTSTRWHPYYSKIKKRCVCCCWWYLSTDGPPWMVVSHSLFIYSLETRQPPINITKQYRPRPFVLIWLGWECGWPFLTGSPINPSYLVLPGGGNGSPTYLAREGWVNSSCSGRGVDPQFMTSSGPTPPPVNRRKERIKNIHCLSSYNVYCR